MVFETQAEAADLIDHLIDPKRELPTFVVTLSDEGQSEHPTIDIAALGRAVLGIGQVALVHSEATWGLTRGVGKLRSVFGGAARVYLPGFNEEADPFVHRLVLANQVETVAGADRTVRWMRQVAAQESVRRVKLGRDVVAFAALRNTALELRQRG
jgi:hypothetical protein